MPDIRSQDERLRFMEIFNDSAEVLPSPMGKLSISHPGNSAEVSLKKEQKDAMLQLIPPRRKPIHASDKPVLQCRFKGVRTRKGVRSFLVEIRPPRWKRTIWLGSYSTEREAAGAYDAGIFYTKPKTVAYNFSGLQKHLPPLPSHLRFDHVEDLEEIKEFVQKQARLAASIAKSRYGENFTDERQNSNSSSGIQNVDTKKGSPETLDAILGAVRNWVDNPNKTAKVEVEKDVSTCQSVQEPDEQERPHGLNVHDSEGAGLSDGSSAMDESHAQVTGDSSCGETSGTERKSIDEDDLIAKLAPFIKQQIEDALTSIVLPLVYVLRSREENEQKHQEKLLALENVKLALRSEKLLLEQRRVGLSQRAPPKAPD